MKNRWLLLILLALSMTSFGQTNDTIGEEITTESILLGTIKEQKAVIILKDNEINKLRNDSLELRKAIVDLEQQKKDLAVAMAQKEEQTKDLQGRLNALQNALNSKDGVLYKQCLLYPLERRYSRQFVDEALSTIEVFATIGQTSANFKKYRETYEPLLSKYGEYNQELIDYLNACKTYITKRQERLGDAAQVEVPVTDWTNELKALPYYKECYVGKDKPPYKSIIYLDERIDEFIGCMKNPDGIVKDIDGLLKKLEPKNN